MVDNEQADLDKLELWVGLLKRLNETKPQMDEFEKRMSRLVEATLVKLHNEIKAALKEHETKTDDDWEPYLDEFDYHDWTPGDFQEAIGNWLKGEINKEAMKLPSHADYSQ